jgi:dienelactone hydrolase
MGISWGGYHTAAVAGVDKRLSAAVIVYGCGELYKNSVWSREGEKFSESYKCQLDPANFLPQSKIPILWLNNNTDHFFPLDSHQSSRKLTAGKSYARIRDNYSHGYETPWKTEDIHLFADAFLKGNGTWPEISSAGITDNMIRVKVKNITRLDKAWLVYTKDSDWMHKSVRKDGNEIWIEKAVALENKKLVKTEIPENAKAVYLHMKDDRGREFSTDYFVPKQDTI